MKLYLKIIFAIIVIYLASYLTSVSSNWSGINLEFGWNDRLYGVESGFPFNNLSCPTHPLLVICSSNSTANIFDFCFWLIILSFIVFIAYKIIKKINHK